MNDEIKQGVVPEGAIQNPEAATGDLHLGIDVGSTTVKLAILDEAQNTTSSQMLMFLTRLGLNSRMVVTGDITQIDLNIAKAKSGLKESFKILKDIDGIRLVELKNEDIVRNHLVQKIIERYDAYHNKD